MWTKWCKNLLLKIVDSIDSGNSNVTSSEAIEIAKAMINIGLDKETIAKSTGLDLSEVEKYIKTLNGKSEITYESLYISKSLIHKKNYVKEKNLFLA